MCVSEKSDLKKKIENNVKPCMVNFIFKKKLSFILKLCIQNNLSNILTYKNRSFFLYSILEFEYRKEKNEK